MSRMSKEQALATAKKIDEQLQYGNYASVKVKKQLQKIAARLRRRVESGKYQ